MSGVSSTMSRGYYEETTPVNKAAFRDINTDILADILARIVASMSACRSACHRNNFKKSRVSDVSARILARMSVSWNASLMTYHPTPPPLCSATQVAPRTASPMQFCTAMSAHGDDPSYTLDVSRYGLSVPLTSWWSRLTTTGPCTHQSLTTGGVDPYRTGGTCPPNIQLYFTISGRRKKNKQTIIQ